MKIKKPIILETNRKLIERYRKFIRWLFNDEKGIEMFDKKNVQMKMICSALLLVSSAVYAGDKTQIRYGVWDRNQLPAIEKIVHQFEEKNPDINVEIELTPYKQYFVKLNAAATGGVTPDVFWMNMPNFNNYAKHGLLAPIDSYIKNNNIDVDQFVGSSVGAYQMDGKQYGIPRDIDSIAVWYNKELFDKAGVSYPTNDWTWQDMETKGIALKKGLNANIYPIMMNLTDGQETYFNFILQAGGDVVNKEKTKTDVGGPAAIKAYRNVQKLMEEKLLPTAQEISELNAGDVFQSGRAGMIYAGSWNALPFSNNKEINNHIGVVTMPKMVRKAGVSHSIAYVMSSKTQHKAESARFLSFLSSDEAQTILAQSRTVIPAKKSVSQEWVNSFKPVDVSAYTKALDTAFQYPTAGNTSKWHSLLNDGLKKVWLGADPEQVMPKVSKRIQIVIDKQ